jgi:hypothetical protein
VYLLSDFFFKNIGAVGNKTAGIYYVKRFANPLGYAVLPVAGNAAKVVYDGFSLF